MYTLIRYSFLFLVLILILSHRGPSHLLLDDISSVQLWGNHAEIDVYEGNGSISVVSNLGVSFLFAAPSGTCISFCIGSCRIEMSVPASNRVSLLFEEASVSAIGIAHLQAEISYGSVYIKDIAYGDISLFRGDIDALVAPKGELFLRGEELNGQVYSNGQGWSHRVHHKGALFEDKEEGEAESSVSVQFFQGRLELLSDSYVMHF